MTGFYSPRMCVRKTFYLNKSNTKWIEMGVIPGRIFRRAVYFCGKSYQIEIPNIDEFIEKIDALSSAAVVDNTTSAVIKAANPLHGSLSIVKSDFGGGTYKIFNTMDANRVVFAAPSTLSAMKGIRNILKESFKLISPETVKKDFDTAMEHCNRWSDGGHDADRLIEDVFTRTSGEGINLDLLIDLAGNFPTLIRREMVKKMCPFHLADIYGV